MARAAERPLLGTREALTVIIDRLAVLFFGRLGSKLVRLFELERSIMEAGMDVYPDIYAARILLYTLVTGIVVGLLGVILFLVLPLDIMLKLVVVGMLAIVPLMVFAMGLVYPSMKKGSREKGVSSELPFFAAYMAVMAFAGMSPERIVESVANLRVFKAIREEARRIIRDMRFFGYDPITAIERNAYYNPSRQYREFMLGYVTTVRTGGDIRHYLELRAQDLFRQQAEELRSIAERVGVIVEAYITLAVVGTLSFFTLFVVSGMIPMGGGGFGGVQGIVMYSFVLMPAITVAMIMAIDAAQPKKPIYNREPYYWLIFSAPAGVLVFLVMLVLTGGVKAFTNPSALTVVDISMVVFSTAIGLMVVAAGPAYSYMLISRRERRLHHALAEFVRDLAEVRKTGLSPEKSIIMLADRDYGTLTPVVRRFAGALSLGLDVLKALRQSLRGYRDWFLLVTMRMLADAMAVGGGSPEILDAMARYVSSLASLQEELRRRLRSYAFIPYFGSLLIAATSILTITLLAQAIQSLGVEAQALTAAGMRISISKTDIAILLLASSVGSMFNAWLMGIMVGKVQSLTTAAGFFHSMILALVTALISVVLMIATASGMLAPAVYAPITLLAPAT